MSVSSLLYPNDFNVYSNFNTSNASFTKSINGVDGGSLLVGDDSPNIFIGNDAVPHNNVYINGVLISPPFGSIDTIGPVGAAPNANGGLITANVLTLEPASATFPGVLTAIAQSIAGVKTFTDNIKMSIGKAILSPANTQWLWSGPFSDTTSIYGGTNAGWVTNNTNHHNVGFGHLALQSATTSTDCVAFGESCLGNLSTGNNIVALGSNAGSAYSTESNNIVINNPGTVADSGYIRIGTNGTHTSCAISGIYSNVIGSPQVCVIDSNSNMGSQTIASIAGVTTMAAIGAAPNANGALISGNTLTLEPASASFGGVLTTGAQTIAGVKTMNNGIQLPAGASVIGVTGAPILWQGPTGVSTDIYVGRLSGNASTGATTRNSGLGQNTMLLKTTGTDNLACGFGSLNALLTGNGNICLGTNYVGTGSGSAYTGAESNNICIGNAGVIADSGTIRIGTSGTNITCFVQGISGVTPGGSPQVVTIGTGGQLGSATIASVSGVTTMAAVGAAPNGNGALISGNTLTLEPADATNPGVMSNTTQSILGAKTWVSDASFSSNVNMVKTANPTSTAGILNIAGSRYLHTSGTGSSPTNVFLGLNSSNIGVSNTSANCNGIGQGVLGALTSGNSNNCHGSGAGSAITSGSFNTCIGQDAGSAISATSANSIMINAIGSGSDTAVTRVGTHGTQTKAFMAGIIGNTAAATTSALVLADTGTSQLGTVPYATTAACATTNVVMSGGGTINTMTVRGVGISTPWPYPTTYTQMGPMIMIRLPAFQVTSITGSAGTDITLATGIPAGIRPTLADVSQAVPDQSGSAFAVSCKVTIKVDGSIHLINTAAFTTNFGLQEDTIISYYI